MFIVVSLHIFLIVQCPDKYETPKICGKAVDDCSIEIYC